ncbi:hypothetical protein [Staphylococcus xylosus]|uniref:hypothetical protein n=1 Tax=Staphylococcus xylosus TaxID=1288 RepID=UPI003F551F00
MGMEFEISRAYEKHDIITVKHGEVINRYMYENDIGELFSEKELNKLFQLLNIFGYEYAKHKFEKVRDTKYIKIGFDENPQLTGVLGMDETKIEDIIFENAPFTQRLLGKQKTSELFKNELESPDLSHCSVQQEDFEIFIDEYINYKGD